MRYPEPHSIFIHSCIKRGLDTKHTLAAARKKFKSKSITPGMVYALRKKDRSTFGFASIKSEVSKSNPALSMDVMGKSFIAVSNAPIGWAEKKRKLTEQFKMYLRALGKHERGRQRLIRTYVGMTARTASK